MTLTLAGRNQQAQLLTGTASPSSWWLMLMVSAPSPTEAMSVTKTREPGGNYARVEIPRGDPYWSAPAAGIVTFLEETTYSPDVDWGVLLYWGLATAATDGTLLRFGPLAEPINAKAGYTLSASGYPRIEVTS